MSPGSKHGLVMACLLVFAFIAILALVLHPQDNTGTAAASADELNVAPISFRLDANNEYADAVIEAQQKIAALTEDVLSASDGSEVASEVAEPSVPSQASSIVGSYTKEWPSEGAEYNPSYSVDIVSVNGRAISFSVSKVGRNLRYLVGTDTPEQGMLQGQLDENDTLHFSYEDDGRGGKGIGTIEIHDGYLVINVTPMYVGWMGENGMTLDTDGPLTLWKVSSDSSGALHVG